MKTNAKQFPARASVMAVRGALLALIVAQPAFASDDEIKALTEPDNTFTIGVGGVDRDSYKFGEYNGLEKRGAYAIGGFDIRYSDGYDSKGVTHWRVTGDDLGLRTRSFSGEYGKQGIFRVSGDFEGIVRNQYDTFQTIYAGSGGTDLTLSGGLRAATHLPAITLPSTASASAANIANWTNAFIANTLSNSGNIQAPNLNAGTLASPNIIAATSAASPNAGLGWLIPAALQNYNVGTERHRGRVGIDVKITDYWSAHLSAFNETKDGTRLTGVGSVNTGSGVTVAEPLQYKTTIFKGGFQYIDSASHFSVDYNGSIFKNAVDTWRVDSFWANNAVQGNVNRLIGAPDNEYHQVKLAGGYHFNRSTRISLTASRALSTQNERFIDNGPFWYVPAQSANAKYINTNFFGQVTSRVTNELDLSGTLRYEDRDSKTPYLQVISTGRDALGTQTATSTNPCGPGALPDLLAIRVGGLTCYDNIPLNIRREQAVFEGNYRIGRGGAIKFGWEGNKVKRVSDHEEDLPFRAEETKENTWKIGYRSTLGETVTGRIGYEYSQRRHSEYEMEEPLGGVLGAAVEPFLPNLINFVVANRNRDKVRGQINFQVSETVNFNASMDYNNDKFTDDDLFGKKSAKGWAANLEGSYAPSENFSISAFYTFEDQRTTAGSLSVLRATNIASAATPVPIRGPANCQPYPSTFGYTATGAAINYGSPGDWYTDPCRIWGRTQADTVNTLGVTFKVKPGSHFDVDGLFSYAYSQTPITFTGMQVINNGLSIGAYGTTPAVNNNIFIPTTDVPESNSKRWDFRLSAKYTVDKTSAVRLAYGFAKLTAYDPQLDLYARNAVAIQGYVGTGVTSYNYVVNTFSAAYIYSFR